MSGLRELYGNCITVELTVLAGFLSLECRARLNVGRNTALPGRRAMATATLAVWVYVALGSHLSFLGMCL